MGGTPYNVIKMSFRCTRFFEIGRKPTGTGSGNIGWVSRDPSVYTLRTETYARLQLLCCEDGHAPKSQLTKTNFKYSCFFFFYITDLLCVRITRLHNSHLLITNLFEFVIFLPAVPFPLETEQKTFTWRRLAVFNVSIQKSTVFGLES